ncbi:MAG: HEAT repeat domain-containing protein [Planctomycetota bacterium]|nr:HEAT repeat domain-containing protein [Planctomycetota bacterium]
MTGGRLLLLLAACLGLAGAARADLFILKDNRQVEGTGVEQGDEWVITTYDGKVVRVKKSDVVGLKKEPEKNEYHRRAAALKPDDAAGHYELALWAREKKLDACAESQFKLVLKADPFHEGAGKALGYVARGGRWVPRDEIGLNIGASNQAPAAPGHGDDPRQIAARLAKLDNLASSDGEPGPEAGEMLALAREKPEIFEAVLKLPGAPGGANVQDPAIRARAAQILGWTGDRRAMQALLAACLEFREDDRVCFAAAKALAKLEEPVALRKLVDAAIDPRLPWTPTRRLACAALRRYGDREAVDRLLTAVSFELAAGNERDPQNKLRAGPKGLGTDNPMGIATDAPPPLPTRDQAVLYPALSALKEIIGVQTLPAEMDVKTWKEWWKANRDAFKFKD